MKNEQYEFLVDGNVVDKETGETFSPEYGEFSDEELKQIDAEEVHLIRKENKKHANQMARAKIAFIIISLLILFSILF